MTDSEERRATGNITPSMKIAATNEGEIMALPLVTVRPSVDSTSLCVLQGSRGRPIPCRTNGGRRGDRKLARVPFVLRLFISAVFTVSFLSLLWPGSWG